MKDALDRWARERPAAAVSISWSRMISSALAAFHIVFAFTRSGQLAGIRMLWFCVLPIMCIWFTEAMSEFVGGRIDRRSHPGFVLVFGWIILVLPLIASTFWLLEGVR